MATPVNTKQWKLGDAPPPGFRLVRETLPLPPSRELIVSQIKETLEKGLVQRLTVQVREPIEVLRLVKGDDLDPMHEVLEDDLYVQARNAEITDFPPRGLTSYATLFHLFRLLTRNGLVPRAFLVTNRVLLQRWLQVTESVDELDDIYGVPVRDVDDLPDDVLLLVTATAEAPDEVVASFRVEMDFQVQVKKGAKR